MRTALSACPNSGLVGCWNQGSSRAPSFFAVRCAETSKAAKERQTDRQTTDRQQNRGKASDISNNNHRLLTSTPLSAGLSFACPVCVVGLELKPVALFLALFRCLFRAQRYNTCCCSVWFVPPLRRRTSYDVMGVSMVLVGETLMRAEDPGKAIGALLGREEPTPVRARGDGQSATCGGVIHGDDGACLCLVEGKG